jgi:hypothetical protein
MSLTPAFEHDLFISYAHLDNQQGWITEFHRLLKIKLEEFLGEPSRIWRDPKLTGLDIIDQSIEYRLRNTAILVSILSPRYLKSDSCLKELKGFLEASKQNRGILDGNKSRVCKIIKTRVPRANHPAELKDQTGYEFYGTAEAEDYPKEFSADAKDASYSCFNEKVSVIAFAVSELLRAMRWKSKTPGSTIYIAETTSDLAGERSQLQNSLYQSNHTVLPERMLQSLNAAELETAVSEDLKRSTVSVHLIGKYYGAIPEGADRSIVDIQLQLAGSSGKNDSPLPRLLWVPAELKAAEQRQEQFLSHVRNDIVGQPGVDLIDKGLAELENVVRDKLKPLQKTQDVGSSNGRRRVYLICDKPDVQEARKIQKQLHENFEVIMPLMEGDPTQAKELHKYNLRSCDAALIYYGLSTESWYQPMFSDVVYKARGYRKRRDWLAKGVYIAPPQTEPKDGFLTHEAVVIQKYEPFKPEFLEPFVEKLKNAK